jgi:hypothetical protein
MDKGEEENAVALKNITPKNDPQHSHANPIFSMETESGPPPYIGPPDTGGSSQNGDILEEGITDERRYTKRATSPSDVSLNGDIQKLDSMLTVGSSSSDTRKRHKSDGALPTTPVSKTFLDPNNKKNSMYESKSTISGVKFDDSFIGTCSTILLLNVYVKLYNAIATNLNMKNERLSSLRACFNQNTYFALPWCFHMQK